MNKDIINMIIDVTPQRQRYTLRGLHRIAFERCPTQQDILIEDIQKEFPIFQESDEPKLRGLQKSQLLVLQKLLQMKQEGQKEHLSESIAIFLRNNTGFLQRRGVNDREVYEWNPR